MHSILSSNNTLSKVRFYKGTNGKRNDAGTDARWKGKNELSKDGQKNALNQEKAVLKAGTKVTVKEVKNIGNGTWIRIPSGWIAGYYNNNIYVK